MNINNKYLMLFYLNVYNYSKELTTWLWTMDICCGPTGLDRTDDNKINKS